MDLLSKRIRKQQERSSLHARQLNKNATALLHKQLHALEKRQQQHARALLRSKQALSQELEDSEEPEHEGADKRGDARKASPSLSEAARQRRSSPFSSSSSSPSARRPDPRGVPCPDPALARLGGSASGAASSDAALAFPGRRQRAEKDAARICRFRALSPWNPCPHFPCRRPHSYHRLKVSDVPDVRSWPLDPELSQGLQPADCCSSDPESGGGGGGGGGPRQGSGRSSPRTSINDRLRGLRLLVREMREKNEEKRPRDWAVNYGSPVSRRLLRKPVVPVADE